MGISEVMENERKIHKGTCAVCETRIFEFVSGIEDCSGIALYHS